MLQRGSDWGGAGLDLGRGQIRLDCAKCDKPDAVVTEGGGPELVRRREPPPMTEVVPTKLRRAREMLLRIQSFYLNAFQSQLCSVCTSAMAASLVPGDLTRLLRFVFWLSSPEK